MAVFSLVGAPAQPAASLAYQLKLALQLRQTPLVIRRQSSGAAQLLACWVSDPQDVAVVQRTPRATLFGVAVRLTAQLAPQQPTQYVEVLSEYGAMAQRTAPFSSMNSTPLEWGYSPALMERALGSSSNISSGEQASRLLALACGGGCPLAHVPASVPLLGACVVDLGCGAGHDLALVSHIVGAGGRTVGIDLTPQMVTRCAAVPTCYIYIYLYCRV